MSIADAVLASNPPPTGVNVIMDNHVWIETQKRCLAAMAKGSIITNHDYIICQSKETNHHRSQRSAQKYADAEALDDEAPVIFLPRPSPSDCKPAPPSMSAYGFLSFALALVNGVISTANNVNNNNNNNNNNDNNNNNNVANVNIANSNSNSNNENTAMAGRRRRRKKLPEVAAPGVMVQQLEPLPQIKSAKDLPYKAGEVEMKLPGTLYAIKRLKLGYLKGGSRASPKAPSEGGISINEGLRKSNYWLKRFIGWSSSSRRRRAAAAAASGGHSRLPPDASSSSDVAEEAALIAWTYIDTMIRATNETFEPSCIPSWFCRAALAARSLQSSAANELANQLAEEAAKRLALCGRTTKPQRLVALTRRIIQDRSGGEWGCRPQPQIYQFVSSPKINEALQTLVSRYEQDLVSHSASPAASESPRGQRSYPTTEPPTVWFPSEVTCPEDNVQSNGSFFSTFQLLSFLLSVFNFATILVSNANSNNRNNNINDNQVNANENNINEGNTNAEVNAMNMVTNLGRRSLSERLIDVWNGALKTRAKRDLDDHVPFDLLYDSIESLYASASNGSSSAEGENEASLSESTLVLLNLWIKAHMVNHRECLSRLFCQDNEAAARRGFYAWAITELGTLAIIDRLPPSIRGNALNERTLLEAAEHGRLGLDCGLLYGPDHGCPEAEWRFIEAAGVFPANPEANRRRAERMLQWAFFRERFHIV